jgi:hypothetical protein
LKVLDQARSSQAAIDVALAIHAGSRFLQHFLAEVGGMDADIPIGQLRKVLAQHHRDGVRLLPAGTRGRPDMNVAPCGAAFDQFGKDAGSERLEGRGNPS